MAQFLSHRFQALKSKSVKLAVSAFLLAVIGVAIWWIASATAPQQALCQSPCLCRYCDEPTINGRCPTSGDGGCIGCAGACAGDNDCRWSGSAGGCGPISCGCRDSDCAAQPEPTSPPATAVPTPTHTATSTSTSTPTRTPTPTSTTLAPRKVYLPMITRSD